MANYGFLYGSEWRTVAGVSEETPEKWQQVWRAIDERREHLRMSFADLYRATETSEGTFRKMRFDGIGVARSNKRRAICAGLGWSADSIERLLAGGHAMSAEDDVPQLGPDVRAAVDRLATISAEVAKIRTTMAEQAGESAALRLELDELRGELAELRRALRRRASGGSGKSR